MLNKETLEHIENNKLIAAAALQAEMCGDSYAVLAPRDWEVIDLETFAPRRRNMRAKFVTSTIDDFRDYLSNEIETTPVYIQPESMTAKSIIDLGNSAAPGHCNHTASLVLTKTAEWDALKSLVGDRLNQRRLAEWCEEWAHMLSYRKNLASEDKINAPQAIDAIRNTELTATATAQHSVGDHSASSSTLAKLETKGRDHSLPGIISAGLTPFHGLSEITVHIRLSVITGADQPEFALRIIREESINQALAEEFRSLIIDKLPNPCIVGSIAV